MDKNVKCDHFTFQNPHSASSDPNQVSLLHSSGAGEHVNHMVAPPQYMQVVHHPSMIHDLYPSHSSGKKPCVQK